MITAEGIQAFSLRAVAKKLGVDPAALYRYYDDLEDLLMQVGDLALAPVAKGFVISDDPRDDAYRLLVRLRKVVLSNGAAQITASGPTRHANELLITEILLDAFDRLGMDPADAAMAYHVLIEYTIGSAVLDAPLAAQKSVRTETYKKWRADYAYLDKDTYPVSRAHAKYLYPGSDKVFLTGLEALIDALLP